MPLEASPRFDLNEFSFFLGRLYSEPFTPVLREESDVYLSLMLDRYAEQSKGGGDWPDLAPSTKAQRKRQGFDPDRPILVRGGTLGDALIEGFPGSVVEEQNGRVVAGIGGDEVHPGYGDRPPSATIAQIAAWQHYGTSRIPAREILAPPDETGVNAIQQAAVIEADRIVKQLIAQSK